MASRPYIDILLNEYAPDFGGIPRPEAQGYLVDAVNVWLTPNGYRGTPVFADVASATAIGGTFTGGIAANYNLAGVSNSIFAVEAGFSSNVFENRSNGVGVWNDVTPAAGTLDSEGDFVFYDDLAMYVCASRAPISKAMSSAHATLFASLSGSPPTGACAARVRDHVVIGGITASATDQFLVRTSAIGDPEDWPTAGTADARAKQSISQYMDSRYGAVRRIIGGEKFGIVMQQFALTRMTYIGGAAVYEFDTFHRMGGSGYRVFPQPVTDGTLWYWYNEDGFYATDGRSAKDLSDGKIREALFLGTLSHPNSSDITQWPFGVYDSRRNLIIFGRSSSYNGAARNSLCYSVETGAFSFFEHTQQSAYLSGFDGGTNPVGRHVFNINGSNKKLQRLEASGTSTLAMQTGFIELDPGYQVQLQGAHILGTGTGSLTLSYKTAATSSACDVSQSGFTSLTAAGLGEKKTARASGQYIAFRITGTGAESQLIRGIRVYFERASPAP